MQRTGETYTNSIVTGVVIGVLLLLILPLAAGAEDADEWATYTFRSGDTVYSLARRYGISPNEILEYNGIEDPGRIAKGQTIRLPGVREISRGDTLYGLSRRYGVSLSDLLEANELDEDDTVFIGDTVVIPGTHTGSGSVTGSAVASNHSDTAGDSDSVDDADSASTVSSAERPGGNAEKAPEWPHDGDRSQRDGRVPGVRIRASEGDPVLAVSEGRVTFVGPYAGFGTVVIVEAANGYVYVYGGHSDVEVSVGEQVERGRPLGTVGRIDSKHEVHFSVWHDDAPVDPEDAPRG